MEAVHDEKAMVEEAAETVVVGFEIVDEFGAEADVVAGAVPALAPALAFVAGPVIVAARAAAVLLAVAAAAVVPAATGVELVAVAEVEVGVGVGAGVGAVVEVGTGQQIAKLMRCQQWI